MQTLTSFPDRIASLKRRAMQLTQLKAIVAGPVGLTARQWTLLDSNLGAIAYPIIRRLQQLNDTFLPRRNQREVARTLNSTLGTLELSIAKAYNYFDTYADVLTQRLSPELGALLAGCDALAYDAMVKDHPSLSGIERPIVYCDRGFGASIVREGVSFHGLALNPFPLIQIPYAKLKDKCNLVSLLHEVGHQTFVRLGLNNELPLRLKANLKKHRAPGNVQELYGLWSSEIGPDFWAFACTGSAQAVGIREILNLPPSRVFQISWGDVHPPPYLRVLLSMAWCREFFGRGEWDNWSEEWKELYPLHCQEAYTQDILEKCIRFIPVVVNTLAHEHWVCLQNRKLSDLFAVNELSPMNIEGQIKKHNDSALDFRGIKPCTQLAIFRSMQSKNIFQNDRLDKIMSDWLTALGKHFINNESNFQQNGKI